MNTCKICGSDIVGNGYTCEACISKGIKWCNKCGRALSIDSFYSLKTRGTLHSNCMNCQKLIKAKKNVKEKSKKPTQTVNQEKCKTCIHANWINSMQMYCCLYILHERKRRQSDPATCDKYIRRKARRI